MMATQKKSTVLKYSFPGTQPPIYLAGSFSNPEWTPLPMQHTVNEQGEYLFIKEVEVEEGKEYQYKFRVGEGEWWLLNEDEPTVTDDLGNRNNLLVVSVHKESITEVDEATVTQENSPATMNESTSSQPVLVIEKIDSAQSLGDDFGQDAAVGQKDAHMLRTLNADPDSVVRARTPDIANNAAEVADSAMTLDRDTPSPPIPDDEAGRTGYRRMSHTPIPEVAETAAEVADVAAILDKDNMPKLTMPLASHFDFDGPMTPGMETPPEEKVPKFAYECLQPPPGGFESSVEPHPTPVGSTVATQETDIDYNDPTLEAFPSDPQAILDQLRTSQSRMAEDQTSFDGIPASPVVGPTSHSQLSDQRTERKDLPSPSPRITAAMSQRSPSLDSIPEANDDEGEYRKEVLTTLPEGLTLDLRNGGSHTSEEVGDGEMPKKTGATKPSVNVQEVAESPTSLEPGSAKSLTMTDTPNLDGTYMEPEPIKLPVTPFLFDNSKQLGEPPTKKVELPAQGPVITVQPATPGSTLGKISYIESLSQRADTAKTSAIEAENGRPQMKSRKATTPTPERPLTPTSLRSGGRDAKSRNFLKAFWRVVFVEWIGGLIMRLCGGDRQKALLAISALVLITLAPAVYYVV